MPNYDTLEYFISSLENRVKSYEQELISLEYAKSLYQPSVKELYANITSDKYYNIEVSDGQNIEVILGGDGRSQPWSESAVGTSITLNVNDGIYLSKAQIDIIKRYLWDIYGSGKTSIKYVSKYGRD